MMQKMVFDNEIWAQSAASVIAQTIREVLASQSACSIFLTGGRGASRVYPFLAHELEICQGNISYYLGDERCVHESHLDSNYGMIRETLFPKGIKTGSELHPMFIVGSTPETAALKYEEKLPEKADVILLGLGDDGHIASLFPGGEWLSINDKKVIVTRSPYNAQERISINRSVIESAGKVLVLASGSSKHKILGSLEDSSNNISSIPALMIGQGIWLLDKDADGQ
jgi:6-phosphogluconolactonase